METSRVTTKGQVTIPQKIRERFDIHAGDVLAFVSAEDGTLRVQKLNLPDVEGAQGRLGVIAAAEGITENDVYRWAHEVRAEQWAERQKGRRNPE